MERITRSMSKTIGISGQREMEGEVNSDQDPDKLMLDQQMHHNGSGDQQDISTAELEESTGSTEARNIHQDFPRNHLSPPNEFIPPLRGSFASGAIQSPGQLECEGMFSIPGFGPGRFGFPVCTAQAGELILKNKVEEQISVFETPRNQPKSNSSYLSLMQELSDCHVTENKTEGTGYSNVKDKEQSGCSENEIKEVCVSIVNDISLLIESSGNHLTEKHTERTDDSIGDLSLSLNSDLTENQIEETSVVEILNKTEHIVSSSKRLGTYVFPLSKRPKLCGHTRADERRITANFIKAQKNRSTAATSSTRYKSNLLKSKKAKAPLRLKQSISDCTMREYRELQRSWAPPPLAMVTPKTVTRHPVLIPFIAEYLNATHPRLQLSFSVCQRIEILLRDILDRIGDEAEALMTLSENRNFTPRVLKYAVKFCLDHMKQEADVASGKKAPWMF